jgi:hypothetical protein
VAQVFISYSRKDKEFVQRLADALAAQKREAWVDWKDIAPTAEWQQEILTNIEAADNFVFVIGPESAASPNCRKEIDHAVANHKRMVPIFHRPVPDEAIPEALAKYQRIDFTDSDNFDAKVAALITVLDTDLAWVQTHTRLLIRAREWEREAKDNSYVLRRKDLLEAEQWLARSAGKEPPPATLQSQYILASRQAATRTQQIVIAAVAFAALLATGLAIYAFIERGVAKADAVEAQRQKSVAQQRQKEAEAEKVRAVRSLFSSLSVNMKTGFPGSVCVRPSCSKAPPGDGGSWSSISLLPQNSPSYQAQIKGPADQLVVRDDPARAVTRDFIVARQYGSGHVLVYAQDGLTSDREITDGSDNLLFAENAMRWLAPSTSPTGKCPNGSNTILFWPGTYANANGFAAVSQVIQHRGWNLAIAKPETFEQDLRCAGVLWYLSDWYPPADFAGKDVPLIERFVKEGGGLLVGGLGWSYAEQGPSAPYAANQLGKPFGFAFTADVVELDRKDPIQLLPATGP